MPLKKEGIMKHDSDGQRRLTRVRLCALAVLLLPLLAACAGSSAPPAAGTAPAATTVAGTTNLPQATAAGTAVAATSAAGGTAGAVTATAGSATESVATATSSSATVSAATATAAASWQFNPNHTQITFKLRDTQWSDGKPVTAQDFAYAWQAAADPTLVPPGSLPTGGLIKGEQALSTTPVTDTARLQQARANFGVKALDPRTLQVTFERPAPFFPSLAASSWPVRQDVIEQYGTKW